MQQNGCDTAALQRFNPNSSEGRPRRDGGQSAQLRGESQPQVLHHVRRHGLDGHAVGDQGRLDEQDVRPHRFLGLRAQNGKPVVCVWGFGFNDNNHPWDAPTCLDVVNWLKAKAAT